MAGVAGNAFKAAMLAAGLNKTAQTQHAYLILFKNNHIPTEADVLGDYTEATFSGYAPVTLLGSGWSVTTAAPAVATHSEQTFESDADQTPESIYGYAIFFDDDTFVCAEKFGSPQIVQSLGDAVKVTPRVRNYTKA